MNARRILALTLVAGVFIMDGYDLNAMPLAVPHLIKETGLAPAAFGLTFSAVLVGLGLGAALFAPLGDRIGRRPMIVFGCLAISLATLGTATATSVTGFAFWRLLTGLGLGACLPNCSALSAELAPPKRKATVMTLVSAGIALGAWMAGEGAPEVVAMGGWQGLFVVPGLFAALLSVALWFVLIDLPETQAPPMPAGAARIPQFELFGGKWGLPFAVYAAMLTLNAVNLYMLSQWAPTILPEAGFSIEQAARLTGRMQLAGLVIGLGLSWLIDRWRPGWSLFLGFAMVSAAFLVIGLAGENPPLWTWLLLVGGGGVTGASAALTALTASLFPARLLSSAIGMGVLIARVGAIAGPLVGSAMISAGVAPATFIMTLVIPSTLCALVCLAIPAALAVRKRLAGEEEAPAETFA